jgi:hypothetical protein
MYFSSSGSSGFGVFVLINDSFAGISVSLTVISGLHTRGDQVASVIASQVSLVSLVESEQKKLDSHFDLVFKVSLEHVPFFCKFYL